MKQHVIILIIVLSTLASCEHESQLSYIIKNSSTSEIKVISINTNTNRHPQGPADTFAISVGESAIIAVNGQGINRVNSYKETAENLRDFTKMDIFKNDTMQSTVDFLKTSRWIYNETDRFTAEYLLTVTDSDF